MRACVHTCVYMNGLWLCKTVVVSGDKERGTTGIKQCANHSLWCLAVNTFIVKPKVSASLVGWYLTHNEDSALLAPVTCEFPSQQLAMA